MKMLYPSLYEVSRSVARIFSELRIICQMPLPSPPSPALKNLRLSFSLAWQGHCVNIMPIGKNLLVSSTKECFALMWRIIMG